MTAVAFLKLQELYGIYHIPIYRRMILKANKQSEDEDDNDDNPRVTSRI